jgi:PAS domain S-box-containing protein
VTCAALPDRVIAAVPTGLGVGIFAMCTLRRWTHDSPSIVNVYDASETGVAGFRRRKGRAEHSQTLVDLSKAREPSTPSKENVTSHRRDGTIQTRTLAPADNEQRFRDRFEQGRIPQAMVGLDGRLLCVNDALCKLLDRPPEQLESVSVRDLAHASDTGTADERFAELVAGQRDSDTWERVVSRPDGSAVPVQVHATLLRHSDGTPYAVASFLQRRTDLQVTPREAVAALVRQATEGETLLCQLLVVSLDAAPSVGIVLLPREQVPRSAHPLGEGERALWRLSRVVEGMDVAPDLSRFARERPGFSRLSSRELDVVGRLLAGDRVPAIAEELFITQSTVRNHLSSVFRKLRVRSQQELVTLFRNMDCSSTDT